MDVTAPPQYEQLLDRVLTALKDGSVAVARRHLVKARATFDGADHAGVRWRSDRIGFPAEEFGEN